MQNILFKDKFTLQLNKFWSDKEVDIANCIGMIRDGNIILVDTRVTAPASLKDFLILCFPTLMFSESNRFFKERLFAQLNAVYKEIFQDFKGNYYPKAKYNRDLFKHQKQALSLMIHRQYNLLSFEQGLGKAEWVENKLITPSGTKRMGDINVGDKIIGMDGLPHNVTAIHPQGLKDAYLVKFSDGAEIKCCAEHLWIVDDRSTLYTTGKRKVLSTTDIMNDLKYGNGRLKYSIPKTQGVCFNSKKVPLDPYFLGLMLGDGHFGKSLAFSTDDFELITYIEESLPLDVRVYKSKGNNYSYSIAHTLKMGSENPIIQKFKKLGLMGKRSHDKFIPKEYLINDNQVRLNVLKGILDTDGSINKGGNRISYVTLSKLLAEDVRWIVESLGGLCSIKKENRTDRKNCYYMSIILPNHIIPFRLKRKYNLFKAKQRLKRRMIVSIEPYRKLEMKCISVDTPDKSYLTERFVVTHNTITSATLSKILSVPRTIIICPAGIKWNWYHDMTDDWGYDKMLWTILDSKKSKSVYAFNERFIVVNYEMINKHFDHLTKYNTGHIIIDECQKIKNQKTSIFKAVNKLVKFFPQARVTLLSGTPITNRVNDVFSYFKLCNHPLGHNYSSFIKQYTITSTGRGGEKVIGAKNTDELRLKISNFMIRKKAEECLDLPDLIIKKYHFEMGDIKGEYEEHMRELYESKRELDAASNQQERSATQMKIKGNIHTLNRLLATSKIHNVIPLIDSLVENGRDVIVFSGYRAPILQLEEHYGKSCVKVIGGMDAHEKDKAIQRFTKSKDCNIFLGNFKAAGVGINLVNSKDVIFLNFPFTPDDLEQPYKRAHRIGQKENVNVYYTIVKDSIDEHIFNMIVDKTKDINSILDEGKDGVVHYNQIPNELFNKLVQDYERINNIKKPGGFASIK